MRNHLFKYDIYTNGLKRSDWEWILCELQEWIQAERYRNMHF
jgi:hypothetical protein